MYSVRMSVTRKTSPWMKKIQSGKYGDVLRLAAQRLADEVIEHAQMDYMSKRKTDDPQSMIMDSFYYQLESGKNSFVLEVIAGGAKAPHLKYVEYKRKGFDGYYFMAAGAEYGRENAVRIVREEINKAMRGI